MTRPAPDFRVTADSKDVTDAIRERLMSLTVTDAAGMESDTVEFTLDDRGGGIALPRTGALLSVRLGYREGGLRFMGDFTVDETALSGPPMRMTVRGRAADFRGGIKRPRTRPWHGVAIGEIVADIAAEYGLIPACAARFAAEVVDHMDQADESDLHFLSRLAAARGAVAKPAAGRLVFAPAGEAKSVSGKSLPAKTLTAGGITSWEATLAERGKYPAAAAKWYDVIAGAEKTVTAGSGAPVFTIQKRFASESEAAAAAEARRAAFARGEGTLRIKCPGDPDLMAEAELTVTGIRSGVDGAWRMTRVVHRIDAGGYSCDIEAERMEADK